MGKAPQLVDVICVCNADGEIRPLRLRMEDDNRKELRLEIGEILGIERNLRFGSETITFLCRGRTEAQSHLLEIRFFVRTHNWCMLRSFQN